MITDLLAAQAVADPYAVFAELREAGPVVWSPEHRGWIFTTHAEVHQGFRDLRLSSDPYESFRIFQGRILEQYMAMSGEFKFMVMDANQHVEKQQVLVRKLVSEKIDLKKFKRRSPLPLPPAAQPETRPPETGEDSTS